MKFFTHQGVCFFIFLKRLNSLYPNVQYNYDAKEMHVYEKYALQHRPVRLLLMSSEPVFVNLLKVDGKGKKRGGQEGDSKSASVWRYGDRGYLKYELAVSL
jgi:hypothetical protein